VSRSCRTPFRTASGGGGPRPQGGADALELQERARDIFRRFGNAIRCGVGISTGDAFVGNIGSTQRMQYGAVGYTVDLASRLESLTDEYNVPIGISETAHQHLARRVPTREIGDVVPMDMTRPVTVFAVLTSATHAARCTAPHAVASYAEPPSARRRGAGHSELRPP
jgi:class 3 adenylate cyclase